jgi:FAD/FMN-containing dehydrogenase
MCCDHVMDFDAYERGLWAGRAAAYERVFARLTTHTAGALLDAAGVAAGTRVLDVGTGPGVVAGAAAVVTDVDPGAEAITFGHVADGNVHVNIVPAATADSRHENAVFSLVASLGGSISAEHGIGALKAPWLPLARTNAERALFARIRSALDPSATLNPNVLPRLSGRRASWHLQQVPANRVGAQSAAL